MLLPGFEVLSTVSPRRTMLAAGLIGLAYLAFVLFYGRSMGHAESVDLPSFWGGAQLAFVHRQSPYDLAALQNLLPASSSQHAYPFLYPPPALLVYWPLCTCTYEQARLAFLALNIVLTGAFIALFIGKVARLSLRIDSVVVVVLTLGVLACAPIWYNLGYGQINLVVACLLCGVWFLARDEKPTAAAVCLTLSILFKTYPAILLPLLLIAGQGKVVARTLLLLGLAAGISFVVLPQNVWAPWLRDVVPQGGYGKSPFGFGTIEAQWNQSLSGLMVRKFGARLPSTPSIARLFYGVAAFLLLGSLAAVRKTKQLHPTAAIDHAMTLGILLIFLVSPLSWEHHLVFVLPAVLTLALTALREDSQQSKSVRIAILCIAALLLVGGRLVFYKFWLVFALWSLALHMAFRYEPVNVDANKREPKPS
jgi:Glycosyltransferase family 87